MLVPVLRKISIALKLSPKASGNIAGFATSVPELLTVSFSAASGLIGTSVYNILSSNIINLAMRSIGLRRTSKKEKEDPKSKWGKYDVVLTVIKDRLLGKADFQMGLWYDLTSRRFYTDYDEYDAQFAWDDNVYSSKLPYVDRSAVDEFPDK